MKVCNEVKRLIDESDQPDVIDFQVSNHLSSCAGCRSFADERVALRKLLASGRRVSVPSNFDAMLTARLAEAKAARRLSWLSVPSLMRLGAATAAVVAMVFVAQYENLFSNGERAAQVEPSATATAANSLPDAPQKSAGIPSTEDDVNGFAHIKPGHSQHVAAAQVRLTQRYYPRRVAAANDRVPAEDYAPLQEGGFVLVRGPNGEREVPLPTVSVGAQPLFYSRQSQPVRNVATSF